MTKDNNVEIAKTQKQIENYIGTGQSTVIYNFEDLNGKVMLHVITVNTRHNQSFLFHQLEGIDKLDALQKMLEYVEGYKEKDSSYTVQWSLRGEGELHTSYFRAKNIHEALDKLYFDRDPNSITVFSVMLNPMA